MNYFYSFKCDYCDELITRTAYGIVPGETYSNAMKIVADYFDDNDIINVELRCISDGDVFLVRDKKIIKELETFDYYAED